MHSQELLFASCLNTFEHHKIGIGIQLSSPGCVYSFEMDSINVFLGSDRFILYVWNFFVTTRDDNWSDINQFLIFRADL